jgi:hypothetical protein
MACACEMLIALDTIETWIKLNENERNNMEAIAKRCADLFQRSSSCVGDVTDTYRYDIMDYTN